VVVVAYLLITRPVPGLEHPPDAATPPPPDEAARPAEVLPRVGDPDFRYLSPPDVRR
jgi:hypothetical protein